MAEYIGRFAPSPTGPLHLGSLFLALASYLDARASHGKWLLRMEDLDPPREVAGAADTIIQQLTNHELHWDGSVAYQSHRHEAYREAVEALSAKELIYPCQCTRARLRSLGGTYDGHCRPTGNVGHPSADTADDTPSTAHTATSTKLPPAYRLRVHDKEETTWQDLIQGQCHQSLAQSTGDFVVIRRDGLFAYQLAVSVDDAFQGITHVIRGDDLLDSTPRQIYILQQLGLKVPNYGHIPVIQDHLGNKLSKQRFAPAVNASTPGANLEHCLLLLGFDPVEMKLVTGAPLKQLLEWATANWSRDRIPHFSTRLEAFTV